MSISQSDSLARGVDAGNYDNSYVSTNYAIAKKKRICDEYCKANRAAYNAAYLQGFFISYENHEIPIQYRKSVIRAEKRYGNIMRKHNIYVPKRN